MLPPDFKERRPGRLWRLCYRLGEVSEGAGIGGALMSLTALMVGLWLLGRWGYSIISVLLLLFVAGSGFAFLSTRLARRSSSKERSDPDAHD